MELIRTDSDYALRAMLHLAGQKEWVSCATLAEAEGIPRSFAHKILRRMVAAGLVTSWPGRAGGFRLAVAAGKITLRDILDVVQGPLIVRRCVAASSSCPRGRRCALSARWKGLQRQITSFFEGTTLADMSAATAEKAGAAARRHRARPGRRKSHT